MCEQLVGSAANGAAGCSTFMNICGHGRGSTRRRCGAFASVDPRWRFCDALSAELVCSVRDTLRTNQQRANHMRHHSQRCIHRCNISQRDGKRERASGPRPTPQDTGNDEVTVEQVPTAVEQYNNGELGYEGLLDLIRRYLTN